MLEQLDSVIWHSLSQPSWNKPATVPESIRGLAAATSEHGALGAYNDFLYAVGNNHAGTYFPVVVQTLPFLEEILRHGGARAREVTLDVLVDLTGSFQPELTEGAAELRALVRHDVARFADVIKALAASASPESKTYQLASEVLEILAEPTEVGPSTSRSSWAPRP
jgi:hypothetical protein